MTRKTLQTEATSIVDEEERGDKEGSSSTQYLAALIATLSAFSLGTCLSWTSASIPLLMRPDSKIPITPDQGSWIGSLLTLGAFVGAIPAGSIASIVGPKRTLQLLAFPLFASWVVIAYCGTIYGLYIARFLAGIGAGAVCVAAPAYVAELAEPRIRGQLGTLFQLQITCGLLFGYVLGGSVEDFILLALIPAVIPVVYLTCLSFMPESPVHLCTRRRQAEAATSLRWLRGEHHDVDDEISRIMDGIRTAHLQGTDGVVAQFTTRATLRALVISLGLMVFQQLSGVNAVLFYTGGIFKDSGTNMSPGTCAILIGAVQVLATYTSTLLVDRAGRRVLLLISSSAMSLCLMTLAFYFHLKTTIDMSSYGLVPIISLTVYIIVFSIGFGPVPWILMGELFNPKVKATAMSITAAFNWMMAFGVTKLFQNFVDAFGSGATFGMFGCVCALATVFTLLVLPETKGKDFEEIALMLGDSKEDADADDSDVGLELKKNAI